MASGIFESRRSLAEGRLPTRRCPFDEGGEDPRASAAVLLYELEECSADTSLFVSSQSNGLYISQAIGLPCSHLLASF